MQDLSELALGWYCPIMDHMSMYAVNATAQNTYRSLLCWAENAVDKDIKDILYKIVDTQYFLAASTTKRTNRQN